LKYKEKSFINNFILKTELEKCKFSRNSASRRRIERSLESQRKRKDNKSPRRHFVFEGENL
jgi:hypothetical protein